MVSVALTTLTSSSLQFDQRGLYKLSTLRTYSLATATHRPSLEIAKSRIGSVYLVSIFSRVYVSKEYMQTVPSSEPVTKKSFCS